MVFVPVYEFYYTVSKSYRLITTSDVAPLNDCTTCDTETTWLQWEITAILLSNFKRVNLTDDPTLPNRYSSATPRILDMSQYCLA